MLNAWMSWLPSLQLPLMPPSPSASPSVHWLEAALRQAELGALRRAPLGTTLLAPTDEALRAAGLQPAEMPREALQRWLLGHLTLASPQQGGLLPLLDGNLLRRAEAGPGWTDGEGLRVRLVGRASMREQLQVQPIDRPLATPTQSVWQRVAADPTLARLAGALERCGVHQVLGCGGPFTLFAPSGAALDRAAARLGLGPAALWQDTGRLRALLLDHIVPGRWASGDLPWAGQLRTLGDGMLHLEALGLLRSGDLRLPLAAGSDQPCSNGVLHRLGEVLIPPTD